MLLVTRPAVWFLLGLLALSAIAQGETIRVLSPGQVPADARLKPLKDLNGYFPFTPAKTPEEWAPRAEYVRRQLLVACGLWPQPTRNPLNPVVHGKVDREDYTIERAYFESMPGFFVTGSLYRPKGKSGKLPAVLCPHGHWANGRYFNHGDAELKKELAAGAEKFEEGGRSPLQARCVHLARMGCVVFHYDMIGYADATQLSFELAHRFGKQRPEMIGQDSWGLYSPQAESHFQSIFGLQTWNSIRAIDFVTSLPDVDPTRIGVTGASGGGTQTFMVCAVDPRPTVAFPAVMVSTAMQGGCTCENASNIRIGTGNIEFAAMFAPKPLAMSAADDWTKEMTTKGFPELQQHFRMMGVPDNVSLLSRIEFGHNYNAVSREAMYRWFYKHLKLGDGETPAERDYRRLTQAEMTVWDKDHPQPPSGPDFEKKLLKWWRDDADAQLAASANDAASLAKQQAVVRPALAIVIGRGLPAGSEVEYDQKVKSERGDHLVMAGLLRNKSHGEELPILFVHPKEWNGDVVIWLHEKGKAGLLDGDQPNADVRRLISAGKSVVGVDLVFQGEFLADGKPLEKARKVENPREAAAYSFGYNHTVFAQRVHDVLSVVALVRSHEKAPKSVAVVGLGGSVGAIAAAARVQARDAIDRAVIDTAGFRFINVSDIYSLNFLPGGAKYGDLPGMLVAAAPGLLLLAGENDVSAVHSAYAAAGKAKQLAVHGGTGDVAKQAALEWLLK